MIHQRFVQNAWHIKLQATLERILGELNNRELEIENTEVRVYLYSQICMYRIGMAARIRCDKYLAFSMLCYFIASTKFRMRMLGS